MGKYTKEDILKKVKEDDVEFIRLQFTDIFGDLKNVAITASQIEKALDNKIMFDGSSIEGFARIEESDMYLYPDYDTYQIDNHFARYLLERGKTLDKDSPYMDYFMKAHKILTDKNHKKDTKYYPFKMARLYEPFYENHASHLNEKDRDIIKISTKEILSMMDSYLSRVPDHRTHPAVKDAKKALERILQHIG